MTESISIKLNGEPKAFPAGSTVQDLVDSLELSGVRVAVERNRDIVRRADWPDVELASDDVVEVVHFVGGG